MSGLSTAVGIVLAVCGGMLGGTWNVFLKPNAPRAIAICTAGGWEWENAWFVFFVLHVAIDIVYVLSIIGPATLHAVYAHATVGQMVLVSTFSLLWGVGTVLFGLSVKLLGVAVGTSLVMAVIIVVGTLLPLLLSGSATSVQGLCTLGGVVLGVLGFMLGARATLLRDRYVVRMKDVEMSSRGSEIATYTHESKAPYPDVSMSAYERATYPKELPFGLKILMCFICGAFSSMLQFAFVFGGPLVKYAKDSKGVAGAFAPLVIWLFTFSIESVPNLAHATLLMQRNRTWGRLTEGSISENFGRYLRCILMSLCFLMHINLYGISSYLLGPLGTSVSWPLLMTSTVVSGQLWSLVLNEWHGASMKAIHMNWVSLCVLLAAVSMIAVGGTLLK